MGTKENTGLKKEIEKARVLRNQKPKPIFVSERQLSTYIRKSKEDQINIIDESNDMIEELFLIRYPQLKFSGEQFVEKMEQFYKQTAPRLRWVYFSWCRKLVRFLPNNLHNELRTSRNRNLINKKEQERIRKFKVGIAGLSIGNSAALSIVIQGSGHYIKLADFDTLAGSNLNRIRSSFENIGKKKTYITAEQIYELNPYAKIVFHNGLTVENLSNFFTKPFKLDVVVDAMDDIEMKIRLRLEARKLKIPVVMATDLGDSVLLDVERYDKNKNLPILHGLVDESVLKEISGRKLPKHEIIKLALNIIEPKNIPERKQDSLLLVGKKLVTWPQLGTSAFFSGIAVAYAIRKLALGLEFSKGRALINFDKYMDPNFGILKRKGRFRTQKFLKKLGLV